MTSPQGRFADAALVDGRVLDDVTAYGKHLFAAFGDRIVHVHLGLFGKFAAGDGRAAGAAGRDPHALGRRRPGGPTCAARRRAPC